MFGEFPRQSEDSVREVNWEGWTPPWMGHGEEGQQGHQHGFGGPWQHGWGHHGHHGHHGPRGPFFFGQGRRWNIPEELLALRVQAAEVARLFAIASRGAFGNKERLAQLRAFLDRSHKELAEIIYGSAHEPTPEAGQQASGSPETGEA